MTEQRLPNGNVSFKYSPQGGPVDVSLGEAGEPTTALIAIRDKGEGSTFFLTLPLP